jgi:hypothetical protein
MGRPSGCASHRAELISFAERAERGPRTAAALDHLAGCRRCEADLTEIVLAIHAVRRTLTEARAVEPSADAWDRLLIRVQRPVTSAWRARSSLAGVIVGAGLVAVLVGPLAVFRPSGAVDREPGPAPAVLHARTEADQRAESAFLSRARAERPRSAAATVEPGTSGSWSGPDGIGRVTTSIRIDLPPDRAD